MASAIACGLLSSCDKASDINTADATVSMSNATMRVKENKGLFYVPVAVSGERNGSVDVEVSVVQTDAECKEDVHFLITSKHVTIPAGKNTVNIEIKTVDDRDIEPDREFALKLSAANGAKIDQQNAMTTITLLDNDDIPYDRMAGEWTVTAMDYLADNGSEQVTWTTQLITEIDDTAPEYGTTIVMTPWRIYGGEIYDVLQHTLTFKYNPSSQTATVSMRLGETMAEGLIFGSENEDGHDLTDCCARSATVGQTNYTLNGNVVGTVNSDFTEVRFNLPLISVLFDKNNNPFSYWFYYGDIVLTREK